MQKQAHEIVTDLSRALHEDRWTKQQSSRIGFRLDAGRLTLTARVDRLAVKRRAAVLARLLGQGCEVVDDLRRAAVSPAKDLALGRLAAERLDGEPFFAEHALVLRGPEDRTYRAPQGATHEIRVSARDGAVSLAGTVLSLGHWRLAEALIWWIDACELVHNRLRVDPPEQDDDGELTDAVRTVLEKNPLVDAGQLHVTTAAGIVALEGRLPNPAQRANVIEDVWAVPGVWDVDDRIQTFG